MASVHPFDLRAVLMAKHAQHVVLVHFRSPCLSRELHSISYRGENARPNLPQPLI